MTEPPVKKQKFQNRKKFYQPKKKQYLKVGHKGFLGTCNFNEKDCIRECYNILNQYADELYGRENEINDLGNDQEEKTEESVDIADELQEQINATQTKFTAKRRFQVVDTGASNCIFIKTTLDDPKAIATRIVFDIAETREQKTRHLLRLLPIVAVCKANDVDIISTAGQLCDKYFLKNHTTFSIVLNKRLNDGINRDHLIHEIANLIHAKNVKNKVDLKHANRSLIIEVIKGLCCLTVIDDYLAMKKYNLVELAKADQKFSKEGSKDKQENCEMMKEENDIKSTEPETEENACK